MRQSRYLWIMMLSLICLLGMIYWAGPETVISAFSNGEFVSDEEAAVQRLWRALDQRQTDIAKGLFINGGQDQRELDYWIDWVNNDPLIRLREIEFIKNEDSEKLVKVTWINEQQNVFAYLYSFKLCKTDGGWKIEKMSEHRFDRF